MHLGPKDAAVLPGVAAVLLGLIAPATASEFEGRLALDLEYLGETYFSEQELSALDLGLPGDFLIYADTTRFASDTWLPGQRLDLAWGSALGTPNRWQLESRSAFNRERLSQEIAFRAEVPGRTRGRWLFHIAGAIREDERSLVGHGDWTARAEGTREVPLGTAGRGGLRLGWEHSRTRGDSTSYLYDFDLLRGRLFARGGGDWLPVWDLLLEATTKVVPRGEPGGYREVRVGAVWRPDGPTLELDVRGRDYDQDEAVGRDAASVELRSWQPLGEIAAGPVGLETEAELTGYRGSDDLYYDAFEGALRLRWQPRAGNWTLQLGPAAEGLVDLEGGNRDFLEWTVGGGVARTFGLGGFLDLSVDTGYRDYRAGGGEVITISSLSTSLLRSDYWLLDALALVSLPVGRAFAVDLTASSSWEFHREESERIQVTFATVGVSRSF